MDINNYGILLLSLLTTFVPSSTRHVDGHSLTVCKYLDLSAVNDYANQDVNAIAFVHLPTSGPDTYFTLTPSALSYLEGNSITVSLNIFNLGNDTIEALVIQAVDNIYGNIVGEWTEGLGGRTVSCDSVTQNTIYHFGSVSDVSPTYQFKASDIGGLTIVFRGTVKLKVTENDVMKEYFYFGIQSQQVFPVVASPCNIVPCYNQGTCTASGSTYSCACSPNWTGNQCQVAVPGAVSTSPTPSHPCNSAPCQNGGSCHESTGSSFTCECVFGWSGTQCQDFTPASPCSSGPCQNGGTCHKSATGSSFTCECVFGWSGSFCHVAAPSTCNSAPCRNDGTCHESSGSSYTCVCENGWTGEQCTDNPCIPSPCSSDNTCFFGSGGVICRSNAPSTPAVTSCTANICINGGTCQENPGSASGYQCLCQDTFHGQNCENQGPPSGVCLSNACQNGGTCLQTTDNPDGYVCSCPQMFEGDHCETPKAQPCHSNPCLNGAECFASSDFKFLCQCASTWTGTMCDQQAIDETSPNAVIIGSTMGCLIFLIILIIIIVLVGRWFYKRRNRINQSQPGDPEPIYFNNVHVPGVLRPGVYTGNPEDQDGGLSFNNAGYQNTVILEEPEETTPNRVYESHI